MRYENETRRNGYIIRASTHEGGPFIRDALHVELDTQNWLYDDDDSAARAAQRDGVKLVYGIPYVPDGIYLNMPDNRKILNAYSRRIEAAIQRRSRQAAKTEEEKLCA